MRFSCNYNFPFSIQSLKKFDWQVSTRHTDMGDPMFGLETTSMELIWLLELVGQPNFLATFDQIFKRTRSKKHHLHQVGLFRAFSGFFLHLCRHVGRHHLDPHTAQVPHPHLHHPHIHYHLEPHQDILRKSVKARNRLTVAESIEVIFQIFHFGSIIHHIKLYPTVINDSDT